MYKVLHTFAHQRGKMTGVAWQQVDINNNGHERRGKMRQVIIYSADQISFADVRQDYTTIIAPPDIALSIIENKIGGKIMNSI